MSVSRRAVGVAVAASLITAALALSPSNAAERPAVVDRPPASGPLMAAGLIVTTTGSKPSASLLRTAEGGLPGDIDVAKVLPRGGNVSVLSTSERISVAEAEALADELEQRSDVVSAQPNFVRHAYGASPVAPNDPGFAQEKHLWDPRAKTDTKVKSVLGSSNSFPNGGYSSKAPSIWKGTQGANEVVAVVDTGITNHPDLNNQVLPGYDFVSKFGGFEDTGRDGDGWDADPHDMGDWQDADYCYADSPQTDSSWHGTHVSGIVAAEVNGDGVVGVAPKVKIVPVRVLGLCGGVDDDIAAGIRWAAGLPVAGAPLNANPADVINMSLGGPGACSASPVLASAVAAAQSAGSVVVAAAGNDGVNIDTHPTSPATCPGVISVGSTSEYGDRAGYWNGSKKVIYSNYGSTLDLSAPGGDSFWDKRAILSTVNTGTKGPAGYGFAEYEGTSMAAPVVSAGAALVRSLGNFTVAQTHTTLKAALAPFPSGVSPSFKKCTTSICGKGILDLSRIPAPFTAGSVSGSPVVNETVSAVPGTWSPKPSVFLYAWLRDGSPIAGATASTYTVTAADIGAHLSVRIAPSYAPFSPITSVSAPTSAVPQGPALSLSQVPAKTTYGVPATVIATVGTPDAPVDGPVELRRGSTVLATGTASGGTVDLTIPGTAWVAGTTAVRLAFLGNGTDAPVSTVSQAVTVAKGVSAIATSVPTSVKASAQAKVMVWIRVTGDPAPTGTLTAYDGTKKLVSATVTETNKGDRVVTLPKITKKGKHYIKVVYSGTGNILGKTSSTKTLTVK